MSKVLFIADCPKMKDLYKVKQLLAAACKERECIWRHLGYELSLSRQRLDIIQQDHVNHGIESRCEAMFGEWLDKRPDASWEKLKRALHAVELYDLANVISNWVSPTEISSGCNVDSNIGTMLFNLAFTRVCTYVP